MNRIRAWGFTLVELLVVIAIISILAAIVVPRVQQHILRARMTRSFAEIRSIETEMASMLTHANKDRFRDLFDPTTVPAAPADMTQFGNQVNLFTNAFYVLLRQGRNLDESEILPLKLADGVKGKLSTSYLPDLGQDQWGHTYKFWVGTWGASLDPSSADTALQTAFPLRSYRAAATSDDGSTVYPWVYSANNLTFVDGAEDTVNRKQELDQQLPGNPPLDETFGFPAPKDLGLYIFSLGVNGQPDQNYVLDNVDDPDVPDDYKGGGDDINSWDNEQGWTGFYT